MRHLAAITSVALLAPALHAQGALLDLEGTSEVQSLGGSVAGPGDLDGDGYPDLLTGAPATWYFGVNGGAAYTYSGRTGEQMFRCYGLAAADRFGWCVAGVGDMDGDGLPDIAIGAYPKEGLGYVQVRSGDDGHLIRQWDEPVSPPSHFCSAVAGAGDADADGWPDIVVGASFYSITTGFVAVYSGATGELLVKVDDHPTPPFASSHFGDAVAGLGDVDGDGHDDFIVGAPTISSIGSQNGAALVFSGADGHLIHEFLGAKTQDQLGNSVAGCGDIDLDGTGDIVVGAWQQDGVAFDVGGVHAYSGRNATELHAWVGASSYDALGQSVAGAGDVDADGRPDIVASAPYAYLLTGGYLGGIVLVWSGFDGATLASLQGGHTPTTIWHDTINVAGVGDMNRNGHADVAVGLPDQYDPIFLVSEVHVFELTSGEIGDYGAGCGGTLGAPLDLDVSGFAAPGCTLTLTVAGAPPAAFVQLLVGQAPGSSHLPGGCTLLVSPLLTQLPLQPAGVPLQATLPLQTTGLAFTLQAVALGGSPIGLASSQGVSIVID